MQDRYGCKLVIPPEANFIPAVNLRSKTNSDFQNTVGISRGQAFPLQMEK
jgi:hypothetical protein